MVKQDIVRMSDGAKVGEIRVPSNAFDAQCYHDAFQSLGLQLVVDVNPPPYPYSNTMRKIAQRIDTSKPLTNNDIGDIYDDFHSGGRKARTLPISTVIAWAERRTDIFHTDEEGYFYLNPPDVPTPSKPSNQEVEDDGDEEL